jgi:hypothetical protein
MQSDDAMSITTRVPPLEDHPADTAPVGSLTVQSEGPNRDEIIAVKIPLAPAIIQTSV